MEEVDRQTMAASPWKAAGEDGLPVMHRRQRGSVRTESAAPGWPATRIAARIAAIPDLVSILTQTSYSGRLQRLAGRWLSSTTTPHGQLARVQRQSGGNRGHNQSGRAWERPSGASFETNKTAIIHFTRNTDDIDNGPFKIRGAQVEPKDSVKILGIVMDRQRRFKEQLAIAATKGVKAAMALRRLRLLPPKVSRQLFGNGGAGCRLQIERAGLCLYWTETASIREGAEGGRPGHHLRVQHGGVGGD
ncbi:hypothetical protein JX266_014062 [Neoarthrinium moseri]|nr:hypothetical protein JX266_014062 [Neoarthrinium moseri]